MKIQDLIQFCVDKAQRNGFKFAGLVVVGTKGDIHITYSRSTTEVYRWRELFFDNDRFAQFPELLFGEECGQHIAYQVALMLAEDPAAWLATWIRSYFHETSLIDLLDAHKASA